MRTPPVFALLLLFGLLGAQPSTASLLKSFPDAVPASKAAILRYLIANKSPEAQPLFMEYLGYGMNKVMVVPEIVDMAPEIRELCAKGLANLKDPKMLNFLVFMLNQEYAVRVQREIVNAIGELGDVNCIPWLARRLMETKDQSVAYECVAAIAKYKDDRAIPPLLDIMRGPYIYKSKIVAESALRNLGWPDKIGY